MTSKIGQGHQWFTMHTKRISQFCTQKLFKQNENLKIATKGRHQYQPQLWERHPNALVI